MSGIRGRPGSGRAALYLLPLLAGVPAASAELPPGFSRLAVLAPTIRQDMRYAGSENFAGRPLAGYEAPACILRTEAAQALVRVQMRLAAGDVGLVVFDCYRPARAVADILAWARAEGPQRAPGHPHVDRRNLVELGYVAARSLHATGYAVDLGLVRLGTAATPATPGVPCTAPAAQRGDQGMLDFGTAFDCFDPLSRTAADGLPAEAARNRRTLTLAMQAAGFRNYPREWWHFAYEARQDGRMQDFPVTAP